MRKEVLVATEGATEREVGKKLIDKKMLNNMLKYKMMEKLRREGRESVLGQLLHNNSKGGLLTTGIYSGLLLLLDQERLSTTRDCADLVISHFQNYGIHTNDPFWTHFSLQPHELHHNLFIHESEHFRMALHVADAKGPDGNCDFYGYILQLLEGQYGEDIIKNLIVQS